MQKVLNSISATLWDDKGARMRRQEVLHVELQKVGMIDVKTSRMWLVKKRCMNVTFMRFPNNVYFIRCGKSVYKSGFTAKQFRDKELYSQAVP